MRAWADYMKNEPKEKGKKNSLDWIHIKYIGKIQCIRNILRIPHKHKGTFIYINIA